MTKYLIFKKEQLAWTLISSAEASSTRRALSAATLDGPGEYVAVPERSWQPLTVKTEQVTKVTIG